MQSREMQLRPTKSNRTLNEKEKILSHKTITEIFPIKDYEFCLLIRETKRVLCEEKNNELQC